MTSVRVPLATDRSAPWEERRHEGIVLVGEATAAADVRGVAAELSDMGVVVAFVSRAGHAESEPGPEPLSLSSDRDAERAVDDTMPDVVADVRSAIRNLWRMGVGIGEILIAVAEELTEDERARLVLPPLDRASVVCLDAAQMGSDAVCRVLRGELAHRARGKVPAASHEPGWGVVRGQFEPERERIDEALLTVADGSVGVGGAPLIGTKGVTRRVLRAGVYVGEAAETHLLTGPVSFRLDGELEPDDEVSRSLDLRGGVLHEESVGSDHRVEAARFVSLARPGTAVLRARCVGAVDPSRYLYPPADDPVHDEGDAGARWQRVASDHGGIVAAAAQSEIRDDGKRVIDRVVAYDGHPDVLPDPSPALARLGEASAAGFDSLLAEHRRAWAARWEDADIVIEGDEDLQLATRFALFHLMAAAADGDEAAVGARALTGPGYRGHVFWDADTFVLPFLAATHPAAARAMLEYRIRRLDTALDKAQALGRHGARFPWESARTGADVTPTSARDRAGRPIPIRTGLLEEHIVAEVPWAACCYVDWTGDEEFARGPGVRLLVETARYWASRIRIDPDGVGHIYGVVGPDEYHEPVDDSAFTNVMARWNMRRAAAAVEDGDAGCGVTDAERETWLALAAGLADGYDADTGIYEEFAGFHRLEPLIIEEAAPRRPIAADLLLGAERLAGAQVVKQADVLMLHHLVPDEVEPHSFEPNLRHYEPRTAHGSSLSPAIHASLFARVRNFDRALEALRIAARIDLDDLTGTTGTGLHIATMGGLWQALASGFGGLRPTPGGLVVDPHLPPTWGALDIRVRYRGSRVRVRKEHAHLSVVADRPAAVLVSGSPYTVARPGLEFRRRGASWEVLT